VIVVAGLFGATVASTATRDATPKRWAATFCGATLTWETAVKIDSAELTTALDRYRSEGNLDLRRARGLVVALVGRLASAIDDLSSSINAVGAPQIANRKNLQADVLRAVNTLAKELDHLKNEARTLSTGSAGAFLRGALAIADKIIQSGATGITAVVSALVRNSSPELQDAAEKDPACIALVSPPRPNPSPRRVRSRRRPHPEIARSRLLQARLRGRARSRHG
jgi:hypothetical protein